MERITSLQPLSDLLNEAGPEGVLRELFGDIPYTLLETRDIFFSCGCSRKKVERALISLGEAELLDMQTRERGASITCEFCRKSYQFNAAELEQLIVENYAG
jgi:molecular chaperone Hsp33